MEKSEYWIWIGGKDEPPVLEWCGITFPAGVPVNVGHPHALKKLPGNPFFKRVIEPELKIEVAHDHHQVTVSPKGRRKARNSGTQ